VPLSVTALRVLETLPMFDDDYLFSVRRGRSAVNYQSSKRQVDRLMTDELRDMARRRGDNPNAVQLKEWRIHDLRRTVRSGLSQLRIPREVAEAVLAHVAPGIVGTYDVHDYLDQKADALQKWSALLASIVEPKPVPNNVTALRRA
jgi:hypothetical protein